MPELGDQIPQDLRSVIEALHYEVTWLHGRYKIYRQLYAVSPERVDLLNKSAGTFFNILQHVLLSDIQLSLTKIGDPARIGVNENMTLCSLQKRLLDAGETEAAKKMSLPLKKFKGACASVRLRRNKWIAHFDMHTMLNQKEAPRSGPSLQEIDNALAALREAMNVIFLLYASTSVCYDAFSMQADGESLVRSLRRGLRYSELVDSKIIPREDYRARFRGEI